jgi:hypothetical protein
MLTSCPQRNELTTQCTRSSSVPTGLGNEAPERLQHSLEGNGLGGLVPYDSPRFSEAVLCLKGDTTAPRFPRNRTSLIERHCRSNGGF